MVLIKKFIFFFIKIFFNFFSYKNKNRLIILLENIKNELNNILLKKYFSISEKDFKSGNVYKYTNLVKYTNNKLYISYKDIRAKKTILKNNVLSLIDAKNFDTFLEVGSGVGQNLLEIRKIFKNSYLYGCDFSKEYDFLKNKIDDCDFKYLDLKKIDSLNYYKSKSIDHVFLSHVMEHILFNNIDDINLIRSNIFSHMIRIAKKSVILISDQLFIGHKSMKENVIFVGHNRIVYQSNIINFIPNNYKISFLRGDNDSNIFIIKIENN
jgi:ubiquinone/menaquinone biosynthesis C-methylase UbiE